jgi:predicted DNA-binding transcriptional regulator YafY
LPRKENPDTLAVWDMERNGWRSFRTDSVQAVITHETRIS